MEIDFKNLDLLKQHKQIVVTGPHRSGTTFIAKAISHSFGHTLGLEEGCGEVLAFLQRRIHANSTLGHSAVFQVPLLFPYCHTFDPEVAIVCCRRPIEDIEKSEKRIGWGKTESQSRQGFNQKELNKYFARFKDQHNNKFAQGLADELLKIAGVEDWNKRTLAEVKYWIWENFQRSQIKFAYDLDYSSFSEHPLWVEGELRKSFTSRQTVVT